MSQFTFEHELASAMRLDSALNPVRNSSRPKFVSNTNNSNSNFNPNNFNSNNNNKNKSNRSQSESRLHPSLFNSSRSSTSPNGTTTTRRRSRSKTPTRLTNSLLDLSSLSSGPSSSQNSNSQKSTTPCRGDRFIPNRSTTDLESVQHSFSRSREDITGGDSDNAVSSLSEQLRRQKMSEVFQQDLNRTKILSFVNKAPAADETHANNLKVLYSTGKPKVPNAAKTRQVPSKAEKILDAPGLLDDFYLHLVDWSSNNHLAVALTNSLFVWDANDGTINELFTRDTEEDVICSVKWVTEGNILAVSDVTGNIELWDVTETKLCRVMSGHSDRVSTLGWNDYMLASGCRDGQVHLHDVRVAQHHIATLNGHTQEVCGSAWASNGRYLATGANDNLVLLWDPRNPDQPVYSLTEHQSAVKALSWCPWHSSTLASGGGTSDRSIKFWNASTGTKIRSVDAGSQVSSLVWNSEYKELISGHGFSHNQLTIWNFPKMDKVADLKGHTSRILDVIVSPDGTTIASTAADETIRLWKVWPTQVKKVKANKNAKEGILHSQRMIR